ncbi:MAG: putative toxin-antitoxin system toxin component, PIN family [Patescibacteria group bacterium]
MVKVVLDTNVLINADRGAGNYGKRILDLVLRGKTRGVVSHQVRRENLLLVKKLVTDQELKKEIMRFLDNCEEVKPGPIDITLEDHEDEKLLAAAVGGRANFLITEDRHLLEVEEYQKVKIITPKYFWQWWERRQDESGKTWNNWARNILGK